MAGAGGAAVRNDISHKTYTVGAARTSGFSWTAVEHDPCRFVVTSDDVLVIEHDGGRREPARWIGPLEPDWEGIAEALVVDAFRVTAGGRPLRDWLPGGKVVPDEGHDWGALGLPEGWDTLVASIAGAVPVDDLTLARSSRGVIDLDLHPTLSLAPGDRIDQGELRGTVIAIDRRAGTIGLDTGDGDPISIPVDAIGPKSEAEGCR
jgi:hypothetical protein